MSENIQHQLFNHLEGIKSRYHLPDFLESLSCISRDERKIFITPSFFPKSSNDICVTDLSGQTIFGQAPADDLYTHTELYNVYPEIKCIAFICTGYTHLWSLIGEELRPFSILHARYFRGVIPCANIRNMVSSDFSFELAKLIKRTLRMRHPYDMPAIFVSQHGAYLWSDQLDTLTQTIITLEQLAREAWHLAQIGQLNRPQISWDILETTFLKYHPERTPLC